MTDLHRKKPRKSSFPIVNWGENKLCSLVAQLVKNPSAMQETWIPFMGWEDALEKGKATHFSNLAWRILGVAKSQIRLSNFHSIGRTRFSKNRCLGKESI